MDEIHDIFLNFSARVSNEVRKKIQIADFYINSINRKPWPRNQGRIISYPTFDRAGLGAGFLAFAPIATYNDSSCDIPTTDADNFAATVRTVTLYNAATNSQNYCLRDLETAHEIGQQLQISVDNMADASKSNWSQELQNKYSQFCGKKYIAAPDLPLGTDLDSDGNTLFQEVEPTSPLDWQTLEFIYENLRYIYTPADGAGIDEEGKVIIQLVGEYDVFTGLKAEANMRGDLRAAMAGGQEMRTLLGSPGMPSGKVYNGYKFETVQFAPHYDFVAGEWVQRFPYLLEDKTVGRGLEIDPLYVNAAYTDVVIFSKGVFDHLVPEKPRSMHGYDWNADVDWEGTHRWVKLPQDRDTNPDGSYGFWRSVYAYGPQLQRPDLGIAIRVKRCNKRDRAALTTCASV